jgi:uncharacterized protein (DUF983 family)
MSIGTRLRADLIDGPTLRCAHCGEWWPITSEFWRLNAWDRCTACTRERSRLYQALRRRDPAFRVLQVQKTRRYRAFVAREFPGLLAAYDRERRAVNRAWLRAYRAKSQPTATACACGLELHVESEADVPRVMRRHQATVRHRRWRELVAA